MTDTLLRTRVADLLHLLQFASITTPTSGDAGQAEKAMADIRRILVDPGHALVMVDAQIATGAAPCRKLTTIQERQLEIGAAVERACKDIPEGVERSCWLTTTNKR